MTSIDSIRVSSDTLVSSNVLVSKTNSRYEAKSLIKFTAEDIQEFQSSLSQGAKVAQE